MFNFEVLVMDSFCADASLEVWDPCLYISGKPPCGVQPPQLSYSLYPSAWSLDCCFSGALGGRSQALMSLSGLLVLQLLSSIMLTAAAAVSQRHNELAEWPTIWLTASAKLTSSYRPGLSLLLVCESSLRHRTSVIGVTCLYTWNGWNI